MMKIIYRSDAIRAALAHWAKHYGHYKPDDILAGKPKHAIDAALAKIDPDACTMADLGAAVPMGLLTYVSLDKCDSCGHWCDHCESSPAILVRFGDEPDRNARWQDLCVDCLTAAVAVAERAAIQPQESA